MLRGHLQPAMADDFLLDAFDLENGGWLPGVRLHIRIGGVPTLEATLEEGLRCHGTAANQATATYWNNQSIQVRHLLK